MSGLRAIAATDPALARGGHGGIGLAALGRVERLAEIEAHLSRELPLRNAPLFAQDHQVLLETQSREFAFDT